MTPEMARFLEIADTPWARDGEDSLELLRKGLRAVHGLAEQAAELRRLLDDAKLAERLAGADARTVQQATEGASQAIDALAYGCREIGNAWSRLAEVLAALDGECALVGQRFPGPPDPAADDDQEATPAPTQDGGDGGPAAGG